MEGRLSAPVNHWPGHPQLSKWPALAEFVWKGRQLDGWGCDGEYDLAPQEAPSVLGTPNK